MERPAGFVNGPNPDEFEETFARRVALGLVTRLTRARHKVGDGLGHGLTARVVAVVDEACDERQQ